MSNLFDKALVKVT